MEKVKPWLGEPQNTIAVLQKYGFVFQKKYGQNFLIDPHVLDKIVAAAGIGPDDFVVEIGPGIGTLTQYLAYAARSVCAVEIDKNLIPILEDTLSDYDNVEVINNDVLKVDLAALAKEKNIPWQLKRGVAGGNDAGSIQRAACGCATVTLSVPCRYIHSPSSVCATEHVENLYRLVKAFLDEGGKFGC